MDKLLQILFLITLFSCSNAVDKEGKLNEKTIDNLPQQSQDSIISEHLNNGAWTKELFSNAWQTEIDKGLAKDSTIAYLWQQKAMPLFKQGKYELGMDYIDRAVKYDRQEWQSYRAFIKCIFAKTYRDAIEDFEDYIQRYGNGTIMDHSFKFYIAISYIQLNEFEKAEKILEQEVNYQLEKYGEDWVHHLDLFYLGIAKYEQDKYEDAIELFDRALKLYPNFSDAQMYKGICLRRIGKSDASRALIKEAKANGLNGYTINEDNAIYERYPYQIRWVE